MGKLMLKSNFCTFVFISGQISNGCKWVRRSKIMSVVNLNMAYQVPVWKQKQKTCTLLGLKHKNAILGWDTCTSNLVHIRAGKYRAHRSLNRIQLSRLIQVSLHFSDLGTPALGRGRWVRKCLGTCGVPLHACMHRHMQTGVCTCRQVYACMCACVHMPGVTPTHQNPHPSTLPTPTLTSPTCFNIHSIWWYDWKALCLSFSKLFSDWKSIEY